ncbi:MAG: hypothetical protein HOE11_02675 [Candidatus Diapherotrites archaeon]|nr:hypothetical protein [Candidatus Diapherotrites archaeon]MBT4596521.1 hypothetical protein [Candidatus Diapherotrites archaeon]
MDKTEPLTIVVGRDMEKDWDSFLSGKTKDRPKNMLYLDSYKELSDLLSPKNIGLLKIIASFPKGNSVGELSDKSKRKQEAISRDIKKLKKNGFIETRKDKQKTIVTPKYSKIIIEI